ncbi:MFS transporter [Stygiolobus caldivivus]|uniref:MFS transporter n=1 Tax=Stygiolobus caldivivus TaxID=2824673 RepID=A0A8D5U4W5_9CREN|nr:MFS transporter [Stygiolobus caldivivus]BCU69097.1 MFS transporter [Stygiolobus caldivivus]
MSEYDLKYAYKALVILAPLAVAVMYTEGMLIPALPSIASQFGVSSATVSWVLSIYLLTGTIMNPIAGKLGDIFGKKRVLELVIWIYAIGVTLTGFSPNFPSLLVFRAIQGLGLAMFPLAFSLIREEFPPNLVPKAQGLVSAMFGVGSAIALPLGGYIAQNFGWQYTYHTVIPIVITLAILIHFFIRESRIRLKAKIDYIGVALLGSALGTLIFGFTEAPTYGWTSATTLGSLLVSLVIFVAFFYEEKISPSPLMPLGLMKRRNVLVANIAAIVAGFALFMAYQTLTYLLEEPKPVGFDLDILSTGLWLIPLALVQMAGSVTAGRFISKKGPRPVLIFGSFLLIPAYLILSLLIGNAGLGTIILFASVANLAAALLNVSLINILVFSVERQYMGIATSLNTVFRLLGGTIGPAVAGAIMSTFETSIVYPLVINGQISYMPITVPSDFSFSLNYLVAMGIAIVMAGLSLTSKNIRLGQSTNRELLRE